jgi:hypothetical protein
VIRSLEAGRFVLPDFVLEETQSAEKTQRLVEGPDTVLIESRGTVAFCLTNFKESCVGAYWYLFEITPCDV